MTYEAIAYFVKTWWTLFFVIIFVAVLIYALWPGNKAKFDRASRIPLEEDKNDG